MTSIRDHAVGQIRPVRLAEIPAHVPVRSPVVASDVHAVLDKVLKAALSLLRADRGNIQIAGDASGFRAVQSTPLVDGTGRLVGVLSTHYARPHRPPVGDLQVMTRFGQLIGQAVSVPQDARA